MHLQFHKAISFFHGSLTRRFSGPSDQHRICDLDVLWSFTYPYLFAWVYEKGKRRNGPSQ